MNVGKSGALVKTSISRVKLLAGPGQLRSIERDQSRDDDSLMTHARVIS